MRHLCLLLGSVLLLTSCASSDEEKLGREIKQDIHTLDSAETPPVADFGPTPVDG